MKGSNWTIKLKELYGRALDAYGKGSEMESVFTPDDVAFLARIRTKPVTVWDNVADFHNFGEPAWETFLLVTAIQRFHLFIMQEGKRDALPQLTSDELPAGDEAFEGIEWLPRIVAKAHGLLYGTLPDEVMYNCAIDRAFLKKYDISAPDFLRFVWALDYDLGRIKNWLES